MPVLLASSFTFWRWVVCENRSGLRGKVELLNILYVKDNWFWLGCRIGLLMFLVLELLMLRSISLGMKFAVEK